MKEKMDEKKVKALENKQKHAAGFDAVGGRARGT
jgi:hypothetical protein